MLIQENLEAELETGKVYFCRIHFGPSEMRRQHSDRIASRLIESGLAAAKNEFRGGSDQGFEGAKKLIERLGTGRGGLPVVCVVHDFQSLSAAGVLAFEDIYRCVAFAGRAYYVLNAPDLEAVPERILACSAWVNVS